MTTPRSEQTLEGSLSGAAAGRSGAESFSSRDTSGWDTVGLLDAVSSGESPEDLADSVVDAVTGPGELDPFLEAAADAERDYVANSLSAGSAPDVSGLSSLSSAASEEDLSKEQRIEIANSYLALMPQLEGRLDHTQEQRLVAHLASVHDDPASIMGHLVRLEQAQGDSTAVDSSRLQSHADAFSSVMESRYPDVSSGDLGVLRGRVESLISDMRRDGESDDFIMQSSLSEISSFLEGRGANYAAGDGVEDEDLSGASVAADAGSVGNPGAEQE